MILKTRRSIKFSMLRYIYNVILPYVNVREELPLDRINQKSSVIFDDFGTFRADLLEKLKNHDIHPLFVSAACTDK